MQLFPTNVSITNHYSYCLHTSRGALAGTPLARACPLWGCRRLSWKRVVVCYSVLGRDSFFLNFLLSPLLLLCMHTEFASSSGGSLNLLPFAALFSHQAGTDHSAAVKVHLHHLDAADEDTWRAAVYFEFHH